MKHKIHIIKNKIRNIILFLLIASLSFISFFIFNISPTLAQFNLPTMGSIKPTISLSADPTTPLPNTAITVTANLSGIIGGGNSNYTWFLNGAKQSKSSGINKNILTFRTGSIGTIYQVNVKVSTPNEDLSDTINFTVSDVDLTWNTNSQAPAAYRAKLMPAQNSIVTISAMPLVYRQGTKNKIGPSNLIYNWTIDRKLDSEKSGIDKNYYILGVNNFFGNSYTVRLEVKTTDGAISINKFITIPVVRPQIWLYFSDSNNNQPFGVALKNLTTKSTNFNLIAQTYFFTTPAKNLNWQWLINNEKVDSKNEKPWLATLNLDNNFSGQFSAQIQTIAGNPNNDLEMGKSVINLEIKK